MEIAALIEEAKRVYAAAGLDCGQGLLPPADEAAIDALARELSLPIPPELRAVYRVHGGQAGVGAGVTGLFGEHRLHSPDEVLKDYRLWARVSLLMDPVPAFPPAADEGGYWAPPLIPFASWDAYSLCVHAESAEVWEVCGNPAGLIRHRPSIAAVLREVVAAVRAGGEPQLGAMRGEA